MNTDPNFQTEEDEYQQMLQAAQANARYQQEIEMQKALAAQLREQGQVQEGKMVSGHYIPPSALSQIAGAVGQYKAGRADKAGAAAATGLSDSQASQNQTVLQALLRNRGGGQQIAPANPYPDWN